MRRDKQRGEKRRDEDDYRREKDFERGQGVRLKRKQGLRIRQ